MITMYVVERIRDGKPCSLPAPRRIAEGIADYLERVTGAKYRVAAVADDLSDVQRSALADAFARVQ